MTIYYPDLSNNNWRNTDDLLEFLALLKPQGFSGAVHKVSEGTGYSDPYWGAFKLWCEQNDLPYLGYHYVKTDSPAGQAQRWLRNGGGPVAMLDFEANSGGISNYWAVVNAFNAVGVEIVQSYLPHWYWQNIGSPSLDGVPGLVSSSYFGRGNYASVLYENAGGDSGAGWRPYGGASPVCWQFTDGARIGRFSVDCNAFKGTEDQLKQLFTGAPVSQELSPEEDNQVQLRGPGLKGWPQLGGHTVVDALALIGEKLGVDGFGLPE